MPTKPDPTAARPGDDERAGMGEPAPDTYHDHDSALNWAVRLESVAWLPLIVAALAFALWVTELLYYLPQAFRAPSFEMFLSLGLPLLIPLEAAVVALGVFVLLRAGAQALFMLLDLQEEGDED